MSDTFETVEHEAMATTFRLCLAGEPGGYLRQAGQAACDELDRMESRLSRHVEHSDVARLNRLAAGQSLLVHPDTLECLRIAEALRRETGGAFDVSYASDRAAPQPRFRIEPDEHAVRILASGVRLDLGGIGKGFALDRMAQVLAEWEVEDFLLCASTSTVLARGSRPGQQGWPITFGAVPSQRLWLRDMAFSGSGKSERGEHIVDPATGRPARAAVQAWAIAPSAAEADGLSTAFMVMPAAEAGACCRRRPQVSGWVCTEPNGPLVPLR